MAELELCICCDHTDQQEQKTDCKSGNHRNRNVQDLFIIGIDCACLYDPENTPIIETDRLVDQIIGMILTFDLGMSDSQILKILMDSFCCASGKDRVGIQVGKQIVLFR